MADSIESTELSLSREDVGVIDTIIGEDTTLIGEEILKRLSSIVNMKVGTIDRIKAAFEKQAQNAPIRRKAQ